MLLKDLYRFNPKNHAELLHAEAWASFLLIENTCANSIEKGTIPDKLVRIYEKAQERVYRRYRLAYN